jgi:hypothetical protein
MMQKRAFHLLTSVPVLIYVNDNIIGFSTVHGSAISASASSSSSSSAAAVAAGATITTAGTS